jgi:hypothetical protein
MIRHVTGIKDIRHDLITGLHRILRNRPIILTGAAARSTRSLREFLKVCGVRELLSIDVPGRTASRVAEDMHFLDHFLENPPVTFLERLDAADPTRKALIYAGSFTRHCKLAGRRIIGARQASWFEAERKEWQRQLTSRQKGFRQSFFPIRSPKQLHSIIEKWVSTQPVVVSGDPKAYLATGASHTFLITDRKMLSSQKGRCILSTLAEECSGIRVSAYTPGRPATYYGFVGDGLFVLAGPMEAIVFFDQGTGRIKPDGIQTPFPLNPTLARQGRRIVQHLVMRLVQATSYRGAFCADGTFTPNGFIVHEVNPRICAGFRLLTRITECHLPMSMMDVALREKALDHPAELGIKLQRLFDGLINGPDLALWEDRDKEAALLDAQPLEHALMKNWEDTVRSTLAGERYIPLFDWAPRRV